MILNAAYVSLVNLLIDILKHIPFNTINEYGDNLLMISNIKKCHFILISLMIIFIYVLVHILRVI